MQPVPDVSRQDLLRVIRRDYPNGDENLILDALDGYCEASSEGGRARVQLAIIKLAGRHLDKLPSLVELALTDSRDVISAAEYPRYSEAAGASVAKPMTEELKRIIGEDWLQYQSWLSAS